MRHREKLELLERTHADESAASDNVSWPGRTQHLQTATAAAALAAGAVGGDWRHILNTADLHAGTGQRTERRLRARSRSARLGTTRRAQLNVQRGDAKLLAPG